LDLGVAGLRGLAPLMRALQGQQGSHHMFAVVTDWTAAQAVHLPQGIAWLQTYGLAIVAFFRTLAAGLENLPFDRQQGGPSLFRIASTARHAGRLEALEPVALGHAAKVHTHGCRLTGGKGRSNCINVTGRIRKTANSRTVVDVWAVPRRCIASLRGRNARQLPCWCVF